MHISNELRVGIMFFAGLALLVLLIATLTRWGQTRNAYSFIIRFDQAQGIQSGADVRVSGVKVGQVSDVSLDPVTSAALVTVRVDKRVNLYQGYKFSIGLGGLVGERYIEITPSVTRTARIGPGSKVDGNESTDINQLLGSANTVMTKLSTTADALNAIMGDEATQQHFKRAVADIQKTATSSSQFAEQLNQMARTNRGAIDLVMANLGDVSSDIRRVSDSLSPQLESSKVFSNLDAASKNAVVITERLGRITDAVDTMLNDKTITMNLRDTVSHLRDASANLEQTMTDVHNAMAVFPEVTSNVSKASADLPEITRPFKEIAPSTAANLQAISQEMRSASDTVDGVTQRVSRFSASLNTIKITPEARLLLLTGDEQNTRADVNVDFHGKSNMFRLGISDIGHDTGANVQFGNRIGQNLWFRYGVVQSKFGLGADYQPSDRWRLSGELFDPETVHGNVVFDYRLFSLGTGWWLTSGLYNIFHDNQFGVGLTYRR